MKIEDWDAKKRDQEDLIAGMKNMAELLRERDAALMNSALRGPLTDKEKFYIVHRECCEKMHAIMLRKNSDYCGTDPSPFANFTKVEDLGICSTEQGMLTRLTDKLSRLISFSQKGFFEVSDETFQDCCMDAANYLILLAGYVESKKHGKDQGSQ